MLRLKGPLNANGTGRVEVFYNGIWETICDDEWDFRDARVVCRQLGYQDAARTLRRNEVPSGSGQIWLKDLTCTGREQNITSCPHSGWGGGFTAGMKMMPELNVQQQVNSQRKFQSSSFWMLYETQLHKCLFEFESCIRYRILKA